LIIFCNRFLGVLWWNVSLGILNLERFKGSQHLHTSIKCQSKISRDLSVYMDSLWAQKYCILISDHRIVRWVEWEINLATMLVILSRSNLRLPNIIKIVNVTTKQPAKESLIFWLGKNYSKMNQHKKLIKKTRITIKLKILFVISKIFLLQALIRQPILQLSWLIYL